MLATMQSSVCVRCRFGAAHRLRTQKPIVDAAGAVHHRDQGRCTASREATHVARRNEEVVSADEQHHGPDAGPCGTLTVLQPPHEISDRVTFAAQRGSSLGSLHCEAT